MIDQEFVAGDQTEYEAVGSDRRLEQHDIWPDGPEP
jgi:hypothetical protein